MVSKLFSIGATFYTETPSFRNTSRFTSNGKVSLLKLSFTLIGKISLNYTTPNFISVAITIAQKPLFLSLLPQ